MSLFCPTCLVDENRAGTTCSDCGAKLIDKDKYLRGVDLPKLIEERQEWEQKASDFTGGESGRKRRIGRLNVIIAQAQEIQIGDKKRRTKLVAVISCCALVAAYSIYSNWRAHQQDAPAAPAKAKAEPADQ